MTVVYFDLDGVCAINRPMLAKKFDDGILTSDYDMSNLSDKTKNDIFAFFETEEYVYKCDRCAMVRDAILELHKSGVYISYLTARSPHLREATRKWLMDNGFPNPWRLNFSKKKGEFLRGSPSRETCILVDDVPENCEDTTFTNGGRKSVGLLFQRENQPYSVPTSKEMFLCNKFNLKSVVEKTLRSL